MTKLGDVFLLSHQVTAAASEECARLGHPRIDVDHLLLALLVTDGTAGRRLRDLDITIDRARSAVARVHAERVASLGVRVPMAPPRPMHPVAVERIDWSPRALKLMRSLPSYSDDLPLLQALIEEPSRLPLHILHAVGVDEATVRAATSAPSPAAPLPSQPRPRVTGGKDTSGWRTVTHTGFAPAPPEQVWALITDPGRRTEWDSLVVAPTPLVGTDPLDGRVVYLTRRTTARNGRRIHVPTSQVRMRQTVIEQTPHHIEWETIWPDVTHGPLLRLAIRLQPVAGGTQLELRTRWRRRTGIGGLLRLPLLPLVRFAMKQRLIHLAAGISRTIR